MREAIEISLFYFSGYGIKDEKGKLYFSTRDTTKNNGKLRKSSAVAASYLYENINDSRSQGQIIRVFNLFKIFRPQKFHLGP